MRAVNPFKVIRTAQGRGRVSVTATLIACAVAVPAVALATGRNAAGHVGPAADGQILFQPTYPASGNALDVGAAGWSHVQYPSDDGVPQPDRIEFGPAPGLHSDPFRPRTNVARFELRPYGGPDGDVTDVDGDLASRVEVYDRIATRGTPPADWPDPVGSTRWYSFGVYVPADFPEDPTKWLDFVQWKGLNGGAPPMAMIISGNDFRLGGSVTDQDLGYIDRGFWNWFVIGIHFSASATDGWETVYRDGVPLVHQLPTATMKAYWENGVDVVDPEYFKMGIYRSTTWDVTQDLYLSPITIGTTLQSVTVGNPDEPPAAIPLDLAAEEESSDSAAVAANRRG